MKLLGTSLLRGLGRPQAFNSISNIWSVVVYYSLVGGNRAADTVLVVMLLLRTLQKPVLLWVHPASDNIWCAC